MSRIGKKPIELPENVTVTIKGQVIEVRGSKGTLSCKVAPEIEVKLEDKKIVLTRSTDQKRVKSMHGLYRALLASIVEGVSKGFEKDLELSGVGYRAALQGNKLNLQLGYSHPIEIDPPEGVSFKLEGQTKIKVLGIDKALIGQVAADIKSKRPVEPYKGKGVLYKGQYVRRKAGKAAKSAGAGGK